MSITPTSVHAPHGYGTGKRLALVVGVNKTSSEILSELDHALNDAQAMADVLAQQCGFELITPALLGEHATSTRVQKAVRTLTHNRNEDDFILFYFSGHGQQAYDEKRSEIRNAYLGTADFDEDDVEYNPNMHVSMHWLRECLFEKTSARHVLIILDCCYAEDIRTNADHHFDDLRQQIMYYFEIPGAEAKKRQVGWYIALAAAPYDGTAGEEAGHGKMTVLLLKALRGDEPELLRDKGQVTLDRLLLYIKHAMPAEQKPVISTSDARGEECILVSYPDRIPLASLRKPSRQLVAECPTSYIPFPRNSSFQPRPGEFEQLESLLLQPAAEQQPRRVGLVGVTGMGGIGKTQLAVEFAYHYQDRFPGGVFWMPATGKTLFEWQSEFAKLAFNTGYLPADDDSSSPEYEFKRTRHLCRYLATHADALLILDNVEQPELVLSVLPQLAGGNVRCVLLYTSRITIAPHGIKLHDVKRLPPLAALRLLLAEARPAVWADIEAGRESAEAQAARRVCQRVEYLPLALVHLSGRLLQDKQATLVRLAEVLSAGKLTSLKQILFETFRLSWERVRDDDCRRLFKLACYFPEATPIPLWLLGLAAGLGEDAQSFTPLRDAFLHLRGISLFEELVGGQEQQVRLHPLVREFGQHLLAEESDSGNTLTTTALVQLTNTFIDLPALEQRTRREGYWQCLEQVRAARDYAILLAANQGTQTTQTVVLEHIERWLDRESYILAHETTTLPGIFFQQLFNRSVEARQDLFRSTTPAQWLEQIRQVGAEDQRLLRIFAGHSDWVTSVAFSPDGSHVLTGSYDTTARLWDAATGQLLTSFEGHSSAVSSVAFSPDGQVIMTCEGNGRVFFWRAQGPSRGELLGMYVAVHRVGAVYWLDAEHVVLADLGGASGRPHCYYLRLHGMRE